MTIVFGKILINNGIKRQEMKNLIIIPVLVAVEKDNGKLFY
jgi:hypothetical protein